MIFLDALTTPSKARQHHRNLGTFLERRLPMRALAHLTFPRSVGLEQADHHFSHWIKLVQQHSRQTLGWIRADERQGSGRRHIHAIVVAASALDCNVAAKLWRGQVGSRNSVTALVEVYQQQMNGAAYVLKRMTEEEATLSENLDLFSTEHRTVLNARAKDLKAYSEYSTFCMIVLAWNQVAH